VSNAISSLTDLTDEQAVQAVRLFIDVSPAEIWADGEKPTSARMKQIADAMVANAPADVKAQVAAVAQKDPDGGTATQARVARLVLERLRSIPAFAPAVEEAIQAARTPHKFIVDPITGAFVLGILVLTGKYSFKPGNVQIEPGARIPEILEKLPDVIKALPAEIWTAVAAKL